MAEIGERHHNAALTDEDVAMIRQLYVCRHAQYGSKPLSQWYNVHQNTILKIVRYESRTMPTK